MSTPSQVAFYHSAAWLKTRDAYIKKVGGLCERCLANGIVRSGYIVHHRTYLDESKMQDPTYLLSYDNLEYLCLDCHNLEHYGTKKRYKVGSDGKLIIKG